jgi:hypothetical protein
MAEVLHIEQLLWAVTIGLAAGVFLLLVVRKSDRTYPVFTLYIGLVLVQAAVLVAAYSAWGFRSYNAWLTGWITQAVIICARGAAVYELCRKVLAHYRGVWSLAWRILSVAAAIVFVYSTVASRFEWYLAVPSAERAIEMAIAVVIVGLLFFARHYQVQCPPGAKAILAGFCLYSCFRVFNDTVLERFAYDYFQLWNVLANVAFSFSLVIWGWALLRNEPALEASPALLRAGTYRVFIPEVNRKLADLNDELGRFWKAEAPRP